MKKLLLAVATLALLSTSSFADMNLENSNRLEAKRHAFFMKTQKMMNEEMAMLKKQEAMLTNYQKLLKQMMENDMGSHQ